MDVPSGYGVPSARVSVGRLGMEARAYRWLMVSKQLS